ncbi:hypothetical protein MKK84_29690 [Methylobacterium sp. E-065]|uniref:hypothetical protein n=1 Tax=Methylobacterium sp. E-065 TaxID=2836583 RepID=UPI001FBBACF5|nr:hypothetical protein [Methylobacterium sp. E-065]MCJ2021541.1 hypothetical protein [Methylobacterium sp. E-065]
MNDRIAGYSEADQKIIAVAATIVVGILGFSLAKSDVFTSQYMPYVFFLSAGLINLAVIQSALYSCLTLFALERKCRLTLKIEKIIGIPESETTLSGFGLNLTYRNSYKAALLPYYLFKSLAGAILFSFILVYDIPTSNLKLYNVAYYVSISSCAASFAVVWFNAYEQYCFMKYFLGGFKKPSKYKDPFWMVNHTHNKNKLL